MYREQIDAYIDSKKEEMLSDLSALVRINSERMPEKEGMPYGEGPAAALSAAYALMESYGLQVKNYENRVVTGDFGDQEKELDILAHLDVVPVSEDWTVTQPFEPKIVGNRIYGRGTSDDKGPAIAALYAIRALKELAIPLKKSVRLILGSDEECGSSDLAYYYGIEQEAPCSFTPDADFPLINIEKGMLRAVITAEFAKEEHLPRVLSFTSGSKINVVPHKAVIHLQGLGKEAVEKEAKRTTGQTGVSFQISGTEKDLLVEARGQAAHASTPQDGKNALTASLQLLDRLPLAPSAGHSGLKALNQLFPYEDTEGRNAGIARTEARSGALTLCFSILQYDGEHLHAEMDSRLPVGCDAENTLQPLQLAVTERGLTFEPTRLGEPHCVPEDSVFVKRLLASYEQYFGQKGTPLSTGGGTYVHHLQRGVAFGCMTPDVDNHMHGDDEFMEIDRLLTSAKIFADAIVRICG